MATEVSEIKRILKCLMLKPNSDKLWCMCTTLCTFLSPVGPQHMAKWFAKLGPN